MKEGYYGCKKDKRSYHSLKFYSGTIHLQCRKLDREMG